MKVTEFEANKNFHLARCGDCCGWQYSVVCDATGTHGVISITHCQTEDEYTIDGTSLEGKCPIETAIYPTEPDAIQRFLMERFTRVDEDDPCYKFHEHHDLCPTCHENTLSNIYEVEESSKRINEEE